MEGAADARAARLRGVSALIRLPLRAARAALRVAGRGVYALFASLPFFHFIKNTRATQAPITFELWFWQKVLGFNRKAYWPVHFTSKVVQPENILIGVNANPGIEPGCYIQGIGRIEIGDNTQVASNVGIISANHDLYDNDRHIHAKVAIGSDCWIGMNAVILPGVQLGAFTIVAAGAVVTKSFETGYCVIGGNPAKKLKDLDPDRCKAGGAQGYVGYIRAEDFPAYRKRRLWF